MRLKGRHWVMLWLLIFLVRALVVVARQTAAFRTARRLHDLREERSSLEARRADLERRIRVGVSRQVLVPIAERDARPPRAGRLRVRALRRARRRRPSAP